MEKVWGSGLEKKIKAKVYYLNEVRNAKSSRFWIFKRVEVTDKKEGRWERHWKIRVGGSAEDSWRFFKGASGNRSNINQ